MAQFSKENSGCMSQHAQLIFVELLHMRPHAGLVKLAKFFFRNRIYMIRKI